MIVDVAIAIVLGYDKCIHGGLNASGPNSLIYLHAW